MEEEKNESYVDKMYKVMCIKITNTTNEEKEFTLFGFDKYAHVKGYGTPEGVIIENLQSSNGYASMLYASGTKKRKITVFEFFGSHSNITKCYTLNWEDIKGMILTTPFNLGENKDNLEDTFEGEKKNTLPRVFHLNSESHITGKIDGDSSVVINLYFEDIN